MNCTPSLPNWKELMDQPDFRALCAELLAATQLYTGLNPAASEMSSVEKTEKLMNAMAATTAALATPPPLPPNYIDPEHHGEDRELLQVFYAACNAEGGTADEIHLRGIRAVMAARPALATPPPKLPDHVNLIGFAFGREPWATWLQQGGCLESAHCELSDLMLAVLAHWGRPATPPPEPPTEQKNSIDELIAGCKPLDPEMEEVLTTEARWRLFGEQDSATPPPEPPTDEELQEWVNATLGAEVGDPQEFGWGWHCFTKKQFARAIRAALERWGR